MASTAELSELDRDECLRLLAGALIGRVVFTDAAMPAALPVNYVLDGEEVVFRAADGSKLAAATQRAVVAFEVDDIDLLTRTGWSVLGVGEAYEVTIPERLAELVACQPEAWTSNAWAHTIAIPLQWLSGRRLSVAGPPGDRDHRAYRMAAAHGHSRRSNHAPPKDR